MMTDSAKPSQYKVFIYGSCVSRDTFTYLGKEFALCGYVARQSLISAYAPVNGIKEKLATITSAFQRRQVFGDLDSNLPSELRRIGEVDLIVMDLIDERGGVLDIGGGWVTKLAEFWSAGGQRVSVGARHLAFGTDEHFDLWVRNCDRYLAELETLGLLSKLVVLEVDWADRDDNDQIFDIPGWMTPPAKANLLYRRYYQHLREAGVRIITLPNALSRTTATHQWGMSPFHFVDQAYEFLAASLAARVQELEFAANPVSARRKTAPWGEFTNLGNADSYNYVEKTSGYFTLWSDAKPLDFWIDDCGSNTTLVLFHAALGKSEIEPPVFMGRAVSDNIGVNRVFVSDPALYYSRDLGLGWFLGSKNLDFTSEFAQFLKVLQGRLNAKNLVFFGMSGGGFAALNFSALFSGSLAIPVNPQTRILDYLELHWSAYANACLGANSVSSSRAVLERHPRSDMRKVYSRPCGNTVVYVQNKSDVHAKTQMEPWLDALSRGQHVYQLMGEWGRGHVPPPGVELRRMLAALAAVDGDWAMFAMNVGSSPVASVDK